MKKIRIGDRVVGEGEPCFIIAEAGSNHNRDFKQALKLIDVAKESGADAVKFQTYSAENVYSKKTPKMSYLKKKKLSGENESVWELLKRIEIPREWHKDLADYCEDKEIVFLSTPFDLKAVDELDEVGIPAFKIASFEITHFPLLQHAASKNKPIILSTGMADLSDIEKALDVIYAEGNREVILLQCAINYPPSYKDVHLRAIDTMRQAFQLPVGFSDHTMEITADIAAVALGACVIEKHYTLDRTLPGPDHSFALEPDGLKQMVESIRNTENALGSPIKRHTKAEEEMYRLGRRSLVAACKIPKGTKITREMIEVKRPGYGIPTEMMDVLVGRVANLNIEEDDIFILGDGVMRIVYLGNNVSGLNILKWLMQQSEEIVGLVVHPPEKAKCLEEIIDVSRIDPQNIFQGDEINEANIVEKIKSLRPELFLSVNFDYILQKEVICMPVKGCVNIHTSFLPYNRGYYPNVWSIVEGTPAGVTMHYIDEGIDTGDIIVQREVPVDFADTGETLYHKLEEASLEVFKETWPKIKSDTHKGVKQPFLGTSKIFLDTS